MAREREARTRLIVGLFVTTMAALGFVSLFLIGEAKAISAARWRGALRTLSIFNCRARGCKEPGGGCREPGICV